MTSRMSRWRLGLNYSIFRADFEVSGNDISRLGADPGKQQRAENDSR